MAATGTPTPNIGLRRAQGTDPASVDDINYNSALIDTKLGAVGNSSVQDQIDTLNSNITALSNALIVDQQYSGTLNGKIIDRLSGLSIRSMCMHLNSNNPGDKPDDGHKWGPVLLCKLDATRGFVMYFDSSNGTKIGYTTDMTSIVWT